VRAVTLGFPRRLRFWLKEVAAAAPETVAGPAGLVEVLGRLATLLLLEGTAPREIVPEVGAVVVVRQVRPGPAITEQCRQEARLYLGAVQAAMAERLLPLAVLRAEAGADET